MLEELEALYRGRLPEYRRAAIAIAGDEESGRDAVQEAFAKAIRKRRRFRGDGQLEAWLLRIVVNAARDARRRRVRQPDLPEFIATRAEELGLPLGLLTERQREVLFLHYYADLDYATIAQAAIAGAFAACFCVVAVWRLREVSRGRRGWLGASVWLAFAVLALFLVDFVAVASRLGG
jgi:hypothetical protein